MSPPLSLSGRWFVLDHSPEFGVHLAAHNGHFEEGRGAAGVHHVLGVENLGVEAEVERPGQVVRVSLDSPDDLRKQQRSCKGWMRGSNTGSAKSQSDPQKSMFLLVKGAEEMQL